MFQHTGTSSYSGTNSTNAVEFFDVLEACTLKTVKVYTDHPGVRGIELRNAAGNLLDSAMVGRVDLKADRSQGVLRVNSAWLEPGADPAETSAALADELTAMAGWLGLDGVEVVPRGDLGPMLASVAGGRPTMGVASGAPT